MKPLPGRTLFLLAVLGVVLWVGYQARAVVTPLLAALLAAYVLDPVVRRLERLRLSRNAASGLLVGLTVVGLLGGGAVATSRLVDEATAFYEDVVGEPAEDGALADAEVRLRALLGDEAESLSIERTRWDDRDWAYADVDRDGAFRPGIAREGLARVRRDLAAHPATAAFADRLLASEDVGTMVARSAGQWLTTAAETGQSAAGTALGLLTLLVLFPIYLYYSLSKLAWVYEVSVRHLPASHRDRVVDILGKIHVTLSSFFRGRLILLLVRLCVLLALFAGFGVPFAGVCAAFSVVASLIPVLGAFVGNAAPVLLVLAGDVSTGEIVGLVAAIVVWEAAEQYVLTPMIVGRQVGLHPLTILVSTFVAGDLLGLFGMIVAIPLTAVLKILAIEFVLPEVRRQAGLPERPDAPGAAPGPGRSPSP